MLYSSAAVNKITELSIPPLPQTLLGALELMQAEDDVETADVEKLISHDPAVVARLLRIANSAFYAQQREITVPRRAVVVLGPITVLGLIMSMGMSELKTWFDSKTMAPFLAILAHSVATGYIAQELTRMDPTSDADDAAEAMAAGLLHDLGKMILLYNHPELAASVYAENHGQKILHAEESTFGTTHVEVGSRAAERMKLPTRLADVMLTHHDAPSSDQHPVVKRVHYANDIAHQLGFPELESVPVEVDSAPTSAMVAEWTSRADEVASYVNEIV